MRRYSRYLSVLLILVISSGLCGFAWPTTLDIAADTDKHHVYQYITVDELIRSYEIDAQITRDSLNGKYLLVSGIYENTDGTTFNITTSDYKSLKCVIKDGVYLDLSRYKFREDVIAVYGRFSFTLSGEMQLGDAEKIIPRPVATESMYFTLDGTSFDTATAVERTLSEGRIKYCIPSGWEKIEYNIKENDLGIIDGYQYTLNKLSPGDDVPESLFVCYFDKNLLANSAYITKEDKVEKAIINNITGSPGNPYKPLFPNYYGAKYTYYLSKYTDAFDQKGYHAEYIFLPDADRGMVMYLYIYREPKHLSDVLMIMRFLTIT